MSLSEKLLLLKEKINNNISAVKKRHVYSGNKVDVSEDIMNIRSVPVGQVITGMRRPTAIEYTWLWHVPSQNTILDNGEGIVWDGYAGGTTPRKVYVNGIEIGNVYFQANDTLTFYFLTELCETISIGLENNTITMSGYNHSDFIINENTLSEIYIKTKVHYESISTTFGFPQIYSVLVRYINP